MVASIPALAREMARAPGKLPQAGRQAWRGGEGSASAGEHWN
jgi:hypothetical protein